MMDNYSPISTFHPFSTSTLFVGESDGGYGGTGTSEGISMISFFSRFVQDGENAPVLDPESSPLAYEQWEMHEMEKLWEKTTIELASLTESTGMPLIQENGQRRFGPLPGSPPPAKGSEVFVGKLPKGMNELHIYDVFRQAGEIYQIRLMLDFNGYNRGFCFVQYFRQEHAQRAIETLNHFEIAEGRRIGVTSSVDNCRLFIGGIPKDKSEHDIYDELARLTDNLVRVFARSGKIPSPIKEENRGYAFAEYASHRDAAMARRKMIPGKIPMWGKVVHVDWAEPEQPEAVNRNYGTKGQTQQRPRGRYFNLFEDPVPVVQAQQFAFPSFPIQQKQVFQHQPEVFQHQPEEYQSKQWQPFHYTEIEEYQHQANFEQWQQQQQPHYQQNSQWPQPQVGYSCGLMLVS